MNNNKIRELKVGEETFRFAPLTMDQIETHVEGVEALADFREQRQRTWNTIHASMTNADAKAPSIADLKKKVDLETFLEMHRTALIASGLRDPDPVETVH